MGNKNKLVDNEQLKSILKLVNQESELSTSKNNLPNLPEYDTGPDSGNL